MRLSDTATRKILILATAAIVETGLGQVVHAQPMDAGRYACHAATDSVRHIAFTSSGGISAGAYQAGVTWAIVQLMKTANADSVWRRRIGATSFRLTAAAGASAGNINALAIALAWAAPHERSGPEESLFWRLWVPTGIEELRPPLERSSGEGEGVFSRDFFTNALYPVVRNVANAESLLPCRIPIGLTQTSVRPQSRRVLDTIDVAVQRFVAPAVLNTANRPTARFEQPNRELLQDNRVGAMVMPAVEGPTYAVDSLFSFVEASSAFPVAFAPKRLWYRTPADIDPSTGRCKEQVEGRCQGARTAMFADGGLFDSNPIALALDLTRNYWRTDGRQEVQVVFTNPGILRRRRHVAVEENPVPSGIGGALAYFAGAVPAARQYELFALDRRPTSGTKGRCRAYQAFAVQPLSADRADTVHNTGADDPPLWCYRIAPTTRDVVIFGEYLWHFAAFLGRPLREHDFYVGVYDGIRYFFESLACDLSDEGARTECVKSGLLESAEGRLGIGAVGQRVLKPLLKQETADHAIVHVDAPSTEEDTVRAVVLGQLADAAVRLDVTNRQFGCEGKDVIAQALCQGGLDSLLQAIRTPELQTVIQRAADDCRAAKNSGKGICFIDTGFADLIADPTRAVDSLIRVVLLQLDRVERRERLAKRSNHQLVTKAASAFYELARETRRRGLDLDPSTIPDDAPMVALRSGLRVAIPYNLGMSANRAGLWSSWRPTYYVGSRVGIVTPFGINRMSLLRAATTSWLWEAHVGLGALWRTRSLTVSTFEASAGYGLPISEAREGVERAKAAGTSTPTQPDGRKATPDPFYDVGIYILAGRLRLGWRGYVARSPVVRPPGFVTFSMADANGLFYWLLGPVRPK
jgi:predicted acylesterase/phospholipase RssA